MQLYKFILPTEHKHSVKTGLLNSAVQQINEVYMLKDN